MIAEQLLSTKQDQAELHDDLDQARKLVSALTMELNMATSDLNYSVMTLLHYLPLSMHREPLSKYLPLQTL